MRIYRNVSLAEASTFTFHPRNRQVDRKHLQDIKKQMMKAFAWMPPITINIRTKHVIDGQHRLEGFKQLMSEGLLDPGTLLPVMLVDIPEEEEFAAIIDANIHTRTWTPADFIHSYMKEGNINYVKLDDWAKVHSLTANLKDPTKPKYRYAAIMMKGSTLRRDLPCGNFVVTDEELERANDIHTEVVKLIELFKLPSTGQWLEGLLLSWYKNRGLDKFNDLVRYISAHARLRRLPNKTLSDWDAIFAKVHSELDRKRQSVA